MSVLCGIANLWCEIILVNDQHKTDRGQYFSVAINPTFTVIEVEGDDPINLFIVLIGCASCHGQLGWRNSVVQPCGPAAIFSLLRRAVTCHAQLGSGLCPWGGCPIFCCSLAQGDTCHTRRGWEDAASFHPL